MGYKFKPRENTLMIVATDTGDRLEEKDFGSLVAMRHYLDRFRCHNIKSIVVRDYPAMDEPIIVGDITYEHVPGENHPSGRKRRMRQDA